MSLFPGARLGSYEIVELLGAGGMGEVYRARDTRLNRDVALKVSHGAFSERFAREAGAIAALNHANICTLYDVGPDYLVMEYVEGKPLPVPVPRATALLYADQIADALDHAHRHGVVHRDLKPANILVTRQGVKLLDFGLAKVQRAVSAPDATVTHALTVEGSILGTLHYMSPEQLEGKEADARSDVYSFGCVLYEMISGKRPHDGGSPAGLIASILERKPEPLADAGIGPIVETCLARDPEERWQSMKEVRHALKWAGGQTPRQGAPERSRRRWLPWGIAGVACVAALASIGLWLGRPRVVGPPMQFNVEAPAGGSFNYMITAVAVSPDGRYLVFRAATGAMPPSLWLRPLDSTAARPLPGTENADFPFWSPDSISIGFFAGDKLKKLDIAGGAPTVLCDATGGVMSDALGGTWSRDGVVVFGDRRGLFRVPASGGSPESLIAGHAARLDGAYGLPQFLPDGRRFLYFMASSDSNAEGIYAASLDSPRSGVLVIKSPAKALYVPPAGGRGMGHLLFVRQSSLMAQRFDAGSLRLDGDPTPVAEDVAVLSSLHAASFWASDTGLLAYRGGVALENSTLAWVSRDGRRTGEAAPEDAYTALRLASNGRRVVLGRRDPGASGDIWVYDFERGIKSRLTFDRHVDTSPAWSPDGLRVAFTSDRTGLHQLYWKGVDAAQAEEQLTQTPTSKDLLDWSRDGRFLLYRETGSKSFDLMAFALEQKTPMPVSRSQFDEIDGQFSPDGKWVAYTSNESGRNEVYVIPFASAGAAAAGKWQISSQGGRGPRWRGDSKELYFLSTDNRKIMASSIRAAGNRVEASAPVELFTTSVPPDIGDNLFPYDVTHDGQRFLVEERVERKSAPLTILVNWQSKLRDR